MTMRYTKVKNYTTQQLLDTMKILPSYRGIPKGFHIIAVRSKEQDTKHYTDKLYLFFHKKFIMVMPCTTTSGIYGLKNFWKWNRKGTAVIKDDEIYYNAFMKSDGRRVRHHHNKVQCFRQVKPLLYYRDNNRDGKIDEQGNIFKGIYNTNIHPNSYTKKQGIVSWLIGRWSVGCVVVNDLTKYWKMVRMIPYNYPVTLTILKEF